MITDIHETYFYLDNQLIDLVNLHAQIMRKHDGAVIHQLTQYYAWLINVATLFSGGYDIEDRRDWYEERTRYYYDQLVHKLNTQ